MVPTSNEKGGAERFPQCFLQCHVLPIWLLGTNLGWDLKGFTDEIKSSGKFAIFSRLKIEGGGSKQLRKNTPKNHLHFKIEGGRGTGHLVPGLRVDF